MAKTAFLNTRIEPALKQKAEKIFTAIGVSPSDAVTMFYKQVIYRRGLPFEVCVPNEETLAALMEIDTRGGEIVTSSTDEAFADILKDDTIESNEGSPNREFVQERPQKNFEAGVSTRKTKANRGSSARRKATLTY